MEDTKRKWSGDRNATTDKRIMYIHVEVAFRLDHPVRWGDSLHWVWSWRRAFDIEDSLPELSI